ncbi:MAG: serine/threonine protein kinase [Phycisphaerae bacterium]
MADFVTGYNIIRKLGDGARSEVYRVVRPDTGEVFSLKRVTREDHEDTRFLDQVIREHEIAGRFEHENLRKSFELRRIKKLFRLVEVHVLMEFVDGVSLDKCRPDRIDKAVDLLGKVAQGLDHMHARGFLHTDIKPSNILVTFDGAIKIIDFGQSCEIGFRKPRIQGTPDYIAPEQVERHSLSRQTDVFNLGATLYWALTGKTYPTVIGKHGKRREVDHRVLPPAPSELDPRVPETLSNLAMECCRYERTLRPKDMAEVVERLKTIHLRMSSTTQPDTKKNPGGKH